MMSRATLWLVVLVSSAHALVHVYELALPSVEQQIATEYFADDAAAGKALTGGLSNTWRLMWGLGAILAGWLVDHFGARRLLAIYLLGCGAACALSALATTVSNLSLAMLTMGAMASIYHPAGLSLISHETTAVNRSRALGLHGIFGSAGLSVTPLAIGLLMDAQFGWRQIYWCLVAPGVALGCIFVWQTLLHPAVEGRETQAALPVSEHDRVDWVSYFTLTCMAAMMGFVYSGLMSFLPRYLSGVPGAAKGHYLAAAVLLVGCVGQEFAGRIAKAEILERQLALVTFTNVPFLIWMAFATSWDRALGAGLWALAHFMHQPLYNSLIAKYTPRSRRSLCFGFSFAMGLGLGSFGARFTGALQSDRLIYSVLSGAAALAGVICLVLCWRNRSKPPLEPSPN